MKWKLILCCMCIYGGLFSQSISRTVIGSAGDYFEKRDFNISWTIGEVMTETFESGAQIVTQGFHQSLLTVTSVTDNDLDIAVKVFPNPTVAQLNIEFDGTFEPMFLELVELNGRKLITRASSAKSPVNQIDMSGYASGTYFLQFKSESNRLIKSFKIVKTK